MRIKRQSNSAATTTVNKNSQADANRLKAYTQGMAQLIKTKKN